MKRHLVLALVVLVGCFDDDGGAEPPPGGMGGAPMGGAGGASLTADEWAKARTLSPLPDLPKNPTNRYADDERAARLGQMLFFDASYSGPLSASHVGDGAPGALGAPMEAGKLSCASCHAGEGLDDRRSRPGTVSLGADWLTRNSLPLVNSSYHRWVNWAGRFSAQWELPAAVAENARNMNSDRLSIAHTIARKYRAEYVPVFGALDAALGTDSPRFPAKGKPKASAMAEDGAWEKMTDADRTAVTTVFVNYAKALEAYMRKLVSKNARFDRYVAGDASAMTSDEVAGFRLFVGKAGCVSCHAGPHFTDNQFHNLGLPQTGERVPAMDMGRFADGPAPLGSAINTDSVWSDDRTTGRLAGLSSTPPGDDKGRFRTPSLRGVASTAPYMHAGQLPTLEAVIDYYDRDGGEPPAGSKSALMRPLGLTGAEKAQLVAFLKALTGDPVPPALLADTARK